ncbi:hypothetical protein [Rubellimicrobium arenae]|uniref:hypothetical protein n=1 Tax=Rubellimicrobium arenae TaxID=2817372 RepID=UPI001B318740|nr:hypothetical protein [Rubellimicrobium arenae]
MKLVHLTASTAALLLSSTALFAQQGTSQNLDNVYIDVGGTAVQIPVAQAAEACALDEATIQQVAATRLQESGMDPAVVYGLGNETADVSGSGAAMDSAGADAMNSTDMAADSAATTGEAMDSTGAGTATADAGAGSASGSMESSGGATAGTDMAATDSGAMGTQSGAGAATDSTGMATADAGATGAEGDLSGTISNTQATAADTSATGGQDPMLALAVCQVDQARATELGIDASGAASGSMDSTGGTTTQ